MSKYIIAMEKSQSISTANVRCLKKGMIKTEPNKREFPVILIYYR